MYEDMPLLLCMRIIGGGEVKKKETREKKRKGKIKEKRESEKGQNDKKEDTGERW